MKIAVCGGHGMWKFCCAGLGLCGRCILWESCLEGILVCGNYSMHGLHV